MSNVFEDIDNESDNQEIREFKENEREKIRRRREQREIQQTAKEGYLREKKEKRDAVINKFKSGFNKVTGAIQRAETRLNARKGKKGKRIQSNVGRSSGMPLGAGLSVGYLGTMRGNERNTGLNVGYGVGLGLNTPPGKKKGKPRKVVTTTRYY